MSASPCAIVSYSPRHAAAWKALNEAWILEAGFVLEPKDLTVLGDPQGQVLDRGGHIVLALDEADQAVGCGSLMPMGDGGYEVAKMAVTPSARGQGLSRLILQALEDHARAQGASRLYIETNSALIPAIRLYESFGFAWLPAQDTPYARADVFMEKRL